MKAVIVEIKDGFAAALSDDGCVKKIKNNHFKIGQVIELNTKILKFSTKFVALAASIAAFLILGGVSTWAYTSPYSYVSVDVNPSIEFTINRFDRVLSVKSVNDDGEAFIKEFNLDEMKNETIQNALSATIEKFANSGYFEEETTDVTDSVEGTDTSEASAENADEEIVIDESSDMQDDLEDQEEIDEASNEDNDLNGGIVISTSSEDEEKAKELAEEIQENAKTELEKKEKNVEIEVISVGLERVRQARELGVTPGKLNLVQKLQASAADPDSIIIEDWINKPVKEIMKTIKANRKLQEDGLSEEIIVDNGTEETVDETVTEETIENETNNAVEETTQTEETSLETEAPKETKPTTTEETKNKLKTEIKAQEKAAKTINKAQEKVEKTLEKAQEKAQKASGKDNKKAEKSQNNNKASNNGQGNNKNNNNNGKGKKTN